MRNQNNVILSSYTPPHLSGRNQELWHHGILGQKWGVRRFQNPDGTLTEEGKKRYSIDNWDSNERRIGKEMDRSKDIADASSVREAKALSKGRLDEADFYKDQTVKAVRRLDAASTLLDTYRKQNPEGLSKAQKFISLFSRHKLYKAASSEARSAREAIARAVSVDDKLAAKNLEKRVNEIYSVARPGMAKFEKYQKQS